MNLVQLPLLYEHHLQILESRLSSPQDIGEVRAALERVQRLFDRDYRRSGEPTFNHVVRILGCMEDDDVRNPLLYVTAIDHDSFEFVMKRIAKEEHGKKLRELDEIGYEQIKRMSIAHMKEIGFTESEIFLSSQMDVNYEQTKVEHFRDDISRNPVLFTVKVYDMFDNSSDLYNVGDNGESIKIRANIGLSRLKDRRFRSMIRQTSHSENQFDVRLEQRLTEISQRITKFQSGTGRPSTGEGSLLYL